MRREEEKNNNNTISETGGRIRGRGDGRSPGVVQSAPISATAHLRYMATSRPAIQLRPDQRQAAAADSALEWDASIHGYRRKVRP